MREVLFAAALSPAAIVGFCAAAATIAGCVVGLIFRGAASAWREERDAAVDKAERLEQKVAVQASRIATLEEQMRDLERRTNVEKYAERSAAEHREIVAALVDLRSAVAANTTALEFLFKQAFPVTVSAVVSEQPAA